MATAHTGTNRSQPAVEDSPPRRSIDGERLIAVFAHLIEPIGRSLPSATEVVLHDLSLLPNSIVAIHGNVTGRRVGDPATDLLLEQVSDAADDHAVGYVTKLPDGRVIRSSTMIIRDVSGVRVAAICLNSDLSVWMSAQRIVDTMLGSASRPPGALVTAGMHSPEPQAAPVEGPRTEVFARDVDELAAHLVHTAIERTGVPAELMHKQHKVEVVRDLRTRGMFLIRDGVDMVASSLHVTRFTIYNYLNEIKDMDGAATGAGVDDNEEH